MREIIWNVDDLFASLVERMIISGGLERPTRRSATHIGASQRNRKRWPGTGREVVGSTVGERKGLNFWLEVGV